MDNWYLKTNLYTTNDKTYIKNYSLCKGKKTIKYLDKETTKRINKDKKTNNINYKKINNDYIIDDINFIKKHVKLPSKTITHIKKNIGKYAVLTAISASYLLSSINSHAEPIDEPQIVTEDLDEFTELNISTPITMNRIDDSVYDMVENRITYNQSNDVDNQNTLTFDAEDESSFYLIESILSKYEVGINQAASKYKLDTYLIAGIIAGENPDYKENYSGYAGTGLMCVEAQIWDGFELVEGEPIDCNRMNSDPNYSIDVGCSIFRYYYDKVVSLNDRDYYNYKLSNAECFELSLFCYNKGEGFIYETSNCNNMNEMLDYIKSVPIGCDYYIEHILSKFQDGTILNLTDYNNQNLQIKIENLSLKKERTF